MFFSLRTKVATEANLRRESNAPFVVKSAMMPRSVGRTLTVPISVRRATTEIGRNNLKEIIRSSNYKRYGNPMY